MSTVTVGAAVGPAQALANPVDASAHAQCLNSKSSKPRSRSARRGWIGPMNRQRKSAAPLRRLQLSGPVFSRARDIFAANMTELLDRAEDPARMIRMIILEMEETLVEIRAMRRSLDRRHQGNAARADPARRPPVQLDRKGRAGAGEGPRGPRPRRAGRAAEGGRHGRKPGRRDRPDRDVLKGYEADIAKLQGKLREARARQNAIAAGSKARSPAPVPARSCTAAGPRTRSPSSKFSSAAPISPKAVPTRWA